MGSVRGEPCECPAPVLVPARPLCLTRARSFPPPSFARTIAPAPRLARPREPHVVLLVTDTPWHRAPLPYPADPRATRAGRQGGEVHVALQAHRRDAVHGHHAVDAPRRARGVPERQHLRYHHRLRPQVRPRRGHAARSRGECRRAKQPPRPCPHPPPVPCVMSAVGCGDSVRAGSRGSGSVFSLFFLSHNNGRGS